MKGSTVALAAGPPDETASVAVAGGIAAYLIAGYDSAGSAQTTYGLEGHADRIASGAARGGRLLGVRQQLCRGTAPRRRAIDRPEPAHSVAVANQRGDVRAGRDDAVGQTSCEPYVCHQQHLGAGQHRRL